ncbi:MAG: hypothetical protein AABY22_11420, partial [Nanoarchaeota archaeon]
MRLYQATPELKEFIDKIDITPKKYDETCQEGYDFKGLCEPNSLIVDGLFIPNKLIPSWKMGREQLKSPTYVLNIPSYVGKLKKAEMPTRKIIIEKLESFKKKDEIRDEILGKGYLPDYAIDLENADNCLSIKAEASERPSKEFNFCQGK